MPPKVPPPLVCLASASPRRRELLSQIGIRHEVSVPDIDETPRPQEPPADYVMRMARGKALAVAARGRPLPVLAADTSVVIDGLILGKPAGKAEGVAMLERLAGRTHEVLTAVALAAGGALQCRLSASTVRFRALSRAQCIAYWDSGEPHDKAGAYAVQGLGAVFIEHLAGSYSGVMGLPLYETAALLEAAGIACVPHEHAPVGVA
ncbi:MAG: septum formation inhibitor Maf [Proteobacteria bacterium]|nr:septum formation inhibitor Maf [Pseudomonadota bacterium]